MDNDSAGLKVKSKHHLSARKETEDGCLLEHDRIESQPESNQVVIQMLKENFKHFNRFEETQSKLNDILQEMRKDIHQLQVEVSDIK